jgi:hypothetical protein
MNRYAVGHVVDYRQVTHSVPLEDHNSAIPIHEMPKSGRGKVIVAIRVGQEWRLNVLPDTEAGKKDKVTLLLRVPPDEAIVQ